MSSYAEQQQQQQQAATGAATTSISACAAVLKRFRPLSLQGLCKGAPRPPRLRGLTVRTPEERRSRADLATARGARHDQATTTAVFVIAPRTQAALGLDMEKAAETHTFSSENLSAGLSGLP